MAVIATSCDSSADESSPAPTVAGAVVTAGNSTTPVEASAFVVAVGEAIDAVENELDGPQEFFEVTSSELVTNVFVAVDDGTAAVGYAYLDGELQPPLPQQEAQGRTFVADDVSFDPSRVLSGVAAQLPDTTIDAISVYGDGVGATYVLAATSQNGGGLDIVIGPEGQVLSVEPV